MQYLEANAILVAHAVECGLGLLGAGCQGGVAVEDEDHAMGVAHKKRVAGEGKRTHARAPKVVALGSLALEDVPDLG